MRPIDYINPDPKLLESATPVRRQLLGEVKSQLGYIQPQPEDLPLQAGKPERPLRYGVAFGLARADGAVLLRRRPEHGLLGGMMARWTDAALPFVDASLTAFSLVAQYWTARRYIASWGLWIVVNVVYVGMFVFKELYLTAGLYALFIGLAVVGWRDWSRTAAALRAAAGGPRASGGGAR